MPSRRAATALTAIASATDAIEIPTAARVPSSPRRAARVAMHGMPRYTVGPLSSVAAIEAAVTAWPAVTVAGASFRGVGLPDCITQSQAAAIRMGERFGSHRPVAIEDPVPAA
jgi:protoporphyrinogen oxidase